MEKMKGNIYSLLRKAGAAAHLLGVVLLFLSCGTEDGKPGATP
jgi:hypothetical protein